MRDLLNKQDSHSQKRKSSDVILFPPPKRTEVLSASDENIAQNAAQNHFMKIDDAKTDLNHLPVFDSTYPFSRSEITLGDMHGNAIKMIHLLIKHHVLKGLTENDYQNLLTIYRTPIEELTRHDLGQFKAILRKLEKSTAAEPCFVRFIGDLFADRGQNDFYTLEVFKTLNKHEIPFEVLLSNHDAFFLRFLEKVLPHPSFSIQLLDRILKNLHLSDNHSLSELEQEIVDIFQFTTTEYKPGCSLGSSLLHFAQLLTAQIISLEEVIDLVSRSGYYTDNTIKAVSYLLSPDKKSICYFTHAPTGDAFILKLLQDLNISSTHIRSAEALAGALDKVNEYFFTHFIQHSTLSNAEKSPLNALMWNRFYPQSTSHFKYTQHIYGHHRPNEAEKKQLPNATSIDNLLGLSEDYFIGNDSTVVSGTSRALSNELSDLNFYIGN